MRIQQLLSQLDEPFTGEALFDHLPGIVFFIKNRRGEYVTVNKTLVERCGARDKSTLIGKTPTQVLRPPLGQRFEEQDRAILQSGRPLLSQLELHLHPSRDVGWCLTTKLPLRGRNGAVIGIVGVSQDLRLPNVSTEEYQHISVAVAHAESHLATPPSVRRLAELAEMSPYQLDRRMRRVFGLTTGQWLLKLRIEAAGHLLQDSDASIVAIAQQVGYADQSAFTRQFRRATGLTPREYRNTQPRTS